MLVIAFGVAWSLYDWLFVDNVPGYFASDWRRILLLAVLSIGGGFAVAGFMRLPAVARRRLATTSFAVGAASATWCCGYFIWQFIRFAGVPRGDEPILASGTYGCRIGGSAHVRLVLVLALFSEGL